MKLCDQLRDSTNEWIVILFHIGALSFKENSRELTKTNYSAESIISECYLYAINYLNSYQRNIMEYYSQNNIQPILELMETNGIYRSNKAESFINQDEKIPHSIFVALLSTQKVSVEVEFEYKIETEHINWIDVLSIVGYSIQITEWKNIPIQYVFVPGQDNDPNLHTRKEILMEKVRALRDMKKNDVRKLKVVDYDKFYPGLTMEEIINNTFPQVHNYAEKIQQQHSKADIYVHVALSVGTTWILHDTQHCAVKIK